MVRKRSRNPNAISVLHRAENYLDEAAELIRKSGIALQVVGHHGRHWAYAQMLAGATHAFRHRVHKHVTKRMKPAPRPKPARAKAKGVNRG